MLNSAINLYENGNFSDAIIIFRKLALTKNSEAQLYLGIMFEHGEGVEKNIEEAKNWYRKAYRQKNLDAGFRLQSLEAGTNCRC